MSAALTSAAAAPATVSSLSAAIVDSAGRKISRFDVTLTPEGLGRVDVQLRIDADGKLSAALSFDRPEAASALKAQSGELRASLAQAGFTVAPDALSFDVNTGANLAAALGGGTPGGAGFGDAPGSNGSGSNGSGGFGGSDGSGRSGAQAAFAANDLDDPLPVRGYGGAQAVRGLDIRI